MKILVSLSSYLLPSGSVVGVLTARLQVQVAEAPVIELLAEILDANLKKRYELTYAPTSLKIMVYYSYSK